MNPSLEKPLLPKRLSLSEVRKELRLDGNEFTYCQAVNRLLDYANDGGLKIYISYNLLGYSTHKPRVSNTDDLGNVFQVVYVGTGVKPTLISTADGELRFLSGFFEDGQQFNNISVKEFQQNGINYSCVIEDIQVLHPYDVAEYYFYIYTKDLNEFIDSELSNNNSNTSNNRKVLHSDETGINDKFSVFHNMDRLSYDEVTLTFIAGDMIEIEARKEKCKAGYEFLSLKNMTTGELNKAGLMLLSLAKNEKVPVTNKNIKHKQDLKKVINFEKIWGKNETEIQLENKFKDYKCLNCGYFYRG